jgi:hypothetical protein
MAKRNADNLRVKRKYLVWLGSVHGSGVISSAQPV